MDAPVREPDVDVLMALLHAEVDASMRPSGLGSAPRDWQAARIEAGRHAQVSADRPFHRRPGRFGRVRSAVTAVPKVVIRKLLRWYVEPLAAEQRAFNIAVLRLADDIAAWTAAMHDAERGRREQDDARRRDERDRLAQELHDIEQRLAAHRTEAARLLAQLEDRLLAVERRPADRPDTR